MKILLTGGTGLLALNWACAMRDTPRGRPRDAPPHGASRRARGATARARRRRRADCDALTRLAPDIDRAHGELHERRRLRARPRARASRQRGSLGQRRAGDRARRARGSSTSPPIICSPERARSTPRRMRPSRSTNTRRSKLLAEAARGRAACLQALIVRTNFFGWGHRYRQSFSDWIYYALAEQAAAHDVRRRVRDARSSPTHLARYAHRLLELGARGIYNVVGDERISKYDFGVRAGGRLRIA